jgi:hypothetical protein
MNNALKYRELAVDRNLALADNMHAAILEQARAISVLLSRSHASIPVPQQSGDLRREYAQLCA